MFCIIRFFLENHAKRVYLYNDKSVRNAAKAGRCQECRKAYSNCLKSLLSMEIGIEELLTQRTSRTPVPKIIANVASHILLIIEFVHEYMKQKMNLQFLKPNAFSKNIHLQTTLPKI